MKDIMTAFKLLITAAGTISSILLTGGLLFPMNADAQAPGQASAIRDLREGYLLIRFPAYKAKIDTLAAMAGREPDPDKKARLGQALERTIIDRDVMVKSYLNAFKTEYSFSKVAYFFDYDSRDMKATTLYDLDGQTTRVDITGTAAPVFYLYFERTEESRIDALVIYDQHGKRLPPPFPNNFSRGGFNFLILKIAEKNFPTWRVRKINKRFYTCWQQAGG